MARRFLGMTVAVMLLVSVSYAGDGSFEDISIFEGFVTEGAANSENTSAGVNEDNDADDLLMQYMSGEVQEEVLECIAADHEGEFANGTAGFESNVNAAGQNASAASDVGSAADTGAASDNGAAGQNASAASDNSAASDDGANPDASTTSDARSTSDDRTAILRGTARGIYLTGCEKKLYGVLSEDIALIAAGEKKTAVIDIPMTTVMDKLSYTAEELGVPSILDESGSISSEARDAFKSLYVFDLRKLYNALLTDLPYELYWHDKTPDNACSYSMLTGIGEKLQYYANRDRIYFKESDQPLIRFSFMVAADYSDSGKTGGYKVTGDLARVRTAIDTAAQIITSHKNENDLEKLDSYRSDICSMVMYDDGAETKNYGDPWQMIYVFDGDDSTNVVCEGYSKAFQFLFDNSEFVSAEIECSIVTGYVSDSRKINAAVKHMWNILHMNDGRNYLADITNCDSTRQSGSAALGSPDKLFLRGCKSGSVDSGYKYMTLHYTYTDITKTLFENDELKMASNDYSCPHKSAECTGWVRTKTSDYMTRTCKSCGEKLKKLLPRDELAAKYTPEKVRMISAAGGKKKGTIKFWRVYKNITGYQIALTNRKTGKTVYRTAKTSTKNKRVLTLKNLMQNAKYSVKVRAYHKARGYTFYGKWSKTKTFKTK